MNSTRIVFTKISCAIFAMLILMSCRKDKLVTLEDPNAPYCECCDLVDAPGMITFGDTAEMRVRTLNYPIHFYDNNWDTVIIDMENDGEADFQFISMTSFSSGSGFYPNGFISSLNDSAFFSADLASDTTYYYETVSYQQYDTVVYENNVWYKSCQALTCCDTVLSVGNKLNYYFADDLMSINQNWLSQNLYFHRGVIQYYTYWSPNINDTIKTYENIYDQTCSNIPSSSATYIGIKKINCGEVKLGWIKFNFDSGIKIVEVALQK